VSAAAAPIVQADAIGHDYGTGKAVLEGITLDIAPGEIVLMTGPSGSGKTTLLTLVGALRSTQTGSLRVLGRELRGASPGELMEVRRQIGYVFQAHNLLDSLSARRNVEMSLVHQASCPEADIEGRAMAMLAAVGLETEAERRPDQLSGGQKQRVAIARALVGRPRIVLADEPTASLDKGAGRQVVQLIHDLARRHGSAVLLVTHDDRILDIADRIVHLEDGRLVSFTAAVTTNAQRLLDALTRTTRKGELVGKMRDLPLASFSSLLERVTAELDQFLHVLALSHSAAFESMLDQVLEAFTLKIGELLGADKATLFVVDEERQQLWSKVSGESGEILLPLATGIAGVVAVTGRPLNVPDAYAEPRFNRSVDEATGYRTRSLLCVPLVSASGRVFAVLQLLNKNGGEAFDAADAGVFAELAGRLGVILETWATMTRRPRTLGAGS
jgi:putative ABC transport system ATP-binding protein